MTVGEFTWKEFCRCNRIDSNRITPSDLESYYEPDEGKTIVISLDTFHTLLINMENACLQNEKIYNPEVNVK